MGAVGYPMKISVWSLLCPSMTATGMRMAPLSPRLT